MNHNVDDKLKEQIFNLSRKKVEQVDITDQTNLVEDLGFDSILIVQMIAELEDIFDIVFKDEDLDIDILTKYSKLKELIAQKIDFNQSYEVAYEDKLKG